MIRKYGKMITILPTLQTTFDLLISKLMGFYSEYKIFLRDENFRTSVAMHYLIEQAEKLGLYLIFKFTCYEKTNYFFSVTNAHSYGSFAGTKLVSG